MIELFSPLLSFFLIRGIYRKLETACNLPSPSPVAELLCVCIRQKNKTITKKEVITDRDYEMERQV
ncbi:hypothetical protein LguiB_005282 [Lonicera macranthoides]